MSRKNILSLLLGLMLSQSISAADFHLVTENFPPLNMTSNGTSYARNDRVSGFATDIMRNLFKENGYKVRFTLMSDWDKAYNTAVNETSTGVYSTFRTPEREEHFKWVGPLYEEDWVLLSTSDQEIQIDTLAELHNYKVGSFVFDGITDYLVEQGVKIEPAKNDAVNVVRLKLGEIQFWASSSLTAPYVAANFKVPVKPVHTFNRSSLWLAMNKDTDQKVIDQLNKTLEKMRASGEIQNMIESYNI
ncbi:substrate-binding periplasmic protein [Endozoicomonas arenosclerae]|uniref:substrate-binding periplasmic protein n=1 Tax=Endozoicomonas arenosclerae TaxID=1633495 RepID=UPI0007825809|nr:ABC transporter substrate-binding protein [Endozoicomonas arenosclerae]